MEKVNTLGARMVSYESITNSRLYPRMPAIIRIDGKAFHTFTRGFDRPWDIKFNESMQATAKYLCENIQGAKLAFVQSDEISILMTDYDSYDSERWFDYRVQKVVSVAASMATAKFNELIQPIRVAKGLRHNLAMFDARVFNLSKEEVINYFIWRQQDATRNSVQNLAQANFSHNEIKGINNNELQNKLLVEKDINWNDLEVWKRRGSCVVKCHPNTVTAENIRDPWCIDLEPPIFSNDRKYIDVIVNPTNYIGYIDDITIERAGD